MDDALGEVPQRGERHFRVLSEWFHISPRPRRHGRNLPRGELRRAPRAEGVGPMRLPKHDSVAATRNATASALFVSQKFAVRPDSPYSIVSFHEAVPGVWVFDFGQNMAGITTFNVVCPAGSTTITMNYGESLKEDGTVLNQYGDIMNSQFTCVGTGEVESYTTQHSQYAFRFVQVINLPSVPSYSSFTAYFIHADVPQRGTFSTDSVGLNSIYHATRFSALSNLMDIPTDCPQRERRGWLGDAQLSCETNMYGQDMGAFYTKWMFDVADTQDSQGRIPDCAPYYRHGGLPGDPAWSVAYPAIVEWVSSYNDDDRIVAQHYDGVRAYVESEIAQLEPSGALTFARYGDWCSDANGPLTGCGFTRDDISTFMFLWGVDILAGFATRLNKTADATKYSALAATTRKVYNSLYFHANTSSYSDGYPVSLLLALATPNLVPAASLDGVVNTLLTSLYSGAHSGAPNATTGGIIFMKYAFDVLTAHGATREGLAILLNKQYPSVLNWMDPSGVPATTLWEHWQSTSTVPGGPPGTNRTWGSLNHIMYGGFGAWLYRGVGGLRRAPGSRGWANLRIAPPSRQDVEGFLTTATVEVDTPIGIASVSWDSAPASGTCVADTPENIYGPSENVATFTCTGGVFESVIFASYGLPNATCPGILTPDPTCDAPNAKALVQAACVGKATCSIPATNKFFGGNPCKDQANGNHHHAKRLAVSLGCQHITYMLRVTVPANGAANVAVPLTAKVGPALTIKEGDVSVWANGAFVPGVAGVTSGAASTDRMSVVFQCGGGTYTFVSVL